MQIKTLTAQVKAGPADGLEEGEFLVYPSTFTRTPDSYGDVVAKGAFLDDIAAWKESGNTLPGLYGHRFDDPDYFVAGALDEGEDDHGWWVKGLFDMESPKGPQVYRLVKGRRLTQLSFAYDTLDEGPVELDGGIKANELRKLKRYEFSFVPIGANQDTSVVAVKSAMDALKAWNGLKTGRTLSAKNEKSLRDARDSLDAVLASLGDTDDGKAGAAGTSQDEANGTAETKDEARQGKSEESKLNPSARDLATLMTIELDALSS